MRSVTIAAHVSRAAALIWWRKLVERLGRWGAVALSAALPVGVVGFYVWAWGQVRPLMQALVSEAAIAELALPSLLMSFLVVCAVLRAALLAFDVVALDLRLLLATAPMTRLTKALVQVGPDATQSSLAAVALGSVPVLVFAVEGGRLSVGVALLLCVAGVCLVGAVTTLLEAGLTRLTHDSMAARSGSAVGVLLLVSGGLVALSAQLQAGGLDQPGMVAVGRLPMGDQVMIGVLALLLVLVLLVGWGWAAGLVTDEVLQARHAVPWPTVRRGSVAAVSAAFLWRDPANRIAALALVVIAALGVAFEALLTLPVAWLMIGMSFMIMLCASGLYAYGEFLTLRWRFVSSPADQRVLLLRWILGHWAVGAILAVAVALPGAIAALAFGLTVDPGSLMALAGASLVGLGSCLVAGRILPYERDNVFALAASGTAGLVLFGLTWWPMSQLPVPVMLAGATVVLGLSLVVTVGAENRGWVPA